MGLGPSAQRHRVSTSLLGPLSTTTSGLPSHIVPAAGYPESSDYGSLCAEWITIVDGNPVDFWVDNAQEGQECLPSSSPPRKSELPGESTLCGAAAIFLLLPSNFLSREAEGTIWA